jgi:NDP-sugar pyrophosphorylase family protein
MTSQVQLIVPMTGVGQRFVNAGFLEPKPLIKTAVGTMIENVLDGFPSIQSPLCIISETVRDKAGLKNEIQRIRPKARIIEIPPHKKGPSYAIWVARQHINLDAPVIVSYCDFSGVWSEKEFLEKINMSDGLIQTYTGFHPHMIRSSRFAYVKKSLEDTVIDVQEKMPYTENPMAEEASSGIYGFKSGQLLLSAINSQINDDISLNGEFYTSLTYKNLIAQNREIKTILMKRFFQWGTPEDLRDFDFWAKLSGQGLPKAIATKNSNAIILAAGRGSRVSELAQTEKPFISVYGNSLWSYTAALLRDCDERIVFSNIQNEEKILQDNSFDFLCVVSPKETRSQAESASHALRSVRDRDKPIHIFACDNLFLSADLGDIDALVKDVDLCVWVTRDYAPSVGQKNQYSWVSIDSNEEVSRLTVKDLDPDEKAKLLIGNFSFRSANIAKALIDEMLKEKSNLPREAYLDWVIEIALKRGIKVRAIEIRDFWAVGTPNEFSTLEYWSEVFAEGRVVK